MIRKAKWKGYTALVEAGLVGFFALWNGLSLAWRAAHGVFPTFGFAVGYLLRTAVVFYCAFIAHRYLSAQPMSNSPWQSAGWARIVAGAALLAACIKHFVRPSPTDFQPSTAAEAAGALFAQVVLVPGLGVS
jgi:hypothetical protein